MRLRSSKVENSQAEPEKKKTGFTFNAVGDFSGSDEAKKVLESISQKQASFTLALGDLSYGPSGSEEQWCKIVTDRVGPKHPFQLVPGNHDDGVNKADILKFAKCLPNKIDGLVGKYPTEYYFDYNNLARFILISPDIDNYGAQYTKGNNHYEWVKSSIQDAKKKELKWVFLGMHKNCITPGVKTCEIGEDLLNLAVEQKVDVVLQGHEHAYFRSKQLALSKDCPSILINDTKIACIVGQGNEFEKGKGTIIVISGAGGYKLRDANLQDPEIGYFDSINAANKFNTYGYSRFTVADDTLDSQFVGVSGNGFQDVFTIK